MQLKTFIFKFFSVEAVVSYLLRLSMCLIFTRTALQKGSVMHRLDSFFFEPRIYSKLWPAT